MTSLFTWLDASVAEQTRMREIVKLFSERESRDELGIGQVRDAFSDGLFPGTSTLHTRARYCLFVPWSFQVAAQKARSASLAAHDQEKLERKMIPNFIESGETDGLIGAAVGSTVKNLPSRLYWSALARYEILVSAPLSREAAIEQTWLSTRSTDGVMMTSPWATSMPAIPSAFPTGNFGGFTLKFDEAHWLQEKIRAAAPGSLLSHLLDPAHRPSAGTDAPWDDPAQESAPQPVYELLRHARLFSHAFNGAAILYGLLLAEKYEEAGYTTVESPIADMRTRLARWEEQRKRYEHEIVGWDLRDMWTEVKAINPNISAKSEKFVRHWVDALRDGSPIADSRLHRGLVAERERSHKRNQSRLHNPRLLQSWQGAAGLTPLNYRWANVQVILDDIHRGLEAHDVAA